MFDGVIGPAGKCGQILQRPSDAVERMQDHSTLIDALFLRCGPSTIIRAVTLFVVDAVKRVFGRGARSHIGKEILERVQPSLTHGDTSASVLLKRLLSRACAAVNHVGPNDELHGMRHAVRSRALDQLFTPETSTGVGSRQVDGLDGHEGSAFAAECVFRPAFVRPINLGDDCQPSVLKTNGQDAHLSILPYFGPVMAFGVN